MGFRLQLRDYVVNLGIPADYVEYFFVTVLIFGVLVLCFAADFIARKVIVKGLYSLANKTEGRWDDLIIQAKVFDRLARLAPALVLYSSAALIFPDSERLQELVHRITNAYMYLVGAFFVASVIDAGA
ncbi:MAG: hypothetical protein AAF517_26510, partial [Planctomycetota bacterium]